MIEFFNTLTGKLDKFDKEPPAQVGIYTCGPTVYDYAHIGNFRAFVFEDLLRRFLEFKGYKVTHVMNLTDVDDKTIAGAQKAGLKLNDYTAKYIQAFNEDLKTLNCLPPHSQPRATEKIKLMQDLIAKLIQKGIAYENKGSVYYRVSKFQSYGKLSKKKLEMNIKGASERIDSDEYESKEEATDFVLWKGVKEGEAELGAAWDSPWGKGRPGWHIECSAMSMQELGEQFDIHAGGEDLIFPHHENEIAQSEGATGKDPFVKYWLHCKFLLVDNAKMSKSKGNFYTLRDLLKKGHDPMAIRLALLSTHYRQTLNFTEAGIKEAKTNLDKWKNCYFDCMNLKSSGVQNKSLADFDKMSNDATPFAFAGLCDDLNISRSVAAIHEMVKQINTALPNQLSQAHGEMAISFFKAVDKVLGLNITETDSVPDNIKNMLTQLSDCRKSKNFTEADRLRKEIQGLGWEVKDGKPGEPSTAVKK